jgi:homoserine O-succinyltransferase
MPIIVQDKFPAFGILSKEKLFLMKENRAHHQDIRPLKLLILNLMPLKIVTETQLLRLISNSMVQVELTFMHMATHESKNTDKSHLDTYYKCFSDIKDQKFDGLIITGAPVENYDFKNVDFWDEISEVFDWAEDNVTSTMMICWGAQAGLYHYFGIDKVNLPKKQFGIFKHYIHDGNYHLIFGFDDEFYAPQSRHTTNKKEDIVNKTDLNILAESDEAGVFLAASSNYSKIFVTGHLEYDNDTLHKEYIRDKEKGLPIEMPKNYYQDDNIYLPIKNKWRSHGNILFGNWLNYCVYQATNYEL